jgi:hypothetical protein
MTGWWVSPDPLVSSINKNDRMDFGQDELNILFISSHCSVILYLEHAFTFGECDLELSDCLMID